MLHANEICVFAADLLHPAFFFSSVSFARCLPCIRAPLLLFALSEMFIAIQMLTIHIRNDFNL